jgi:hypothetical protein
MAGMGVGIKDNFSSGIKLLAAVVLPTAATCAWSLEPVRLRQESFVSRAVFFDSKLWLLTDAGELTNFPELATIAASCVTN